MENKDINFEEKKNSEGFMAKFGKAVENATNKSKELIGQAQESIVNTIDKNGDGKIDRTDFGLDDENIELTKAKTKQAIYDTGEKIKNTSEIFGKALADAKEEMDRKSLRPVFMDDVVKTTEDGHLISKILEKQQSIIRIVPRDKKREMNIVCNGAIGYRETIKGIDLLSIYEEYAKDLGISFVPNISQTFFYVDPFKEGMYVALDEYFTYFKKQRVNELEMVAQKLGAKRVTITFKEHERNFVKKNASGNVKVQQNSVSASYDGENANEISMEIAADIVFSGHNEPIEPKLCYFKYESDISRLIQMRLDQSTNQIQAKTYKFQCSQTLGIKESVAAQIDGVLHQLKCVGNASVSEETRKEGRTTLEYYIEF